jgi:hypothetical protein
MADATSDDELNSILGVRGVTMAAEQAQQRAVMTNTHALEQAALAASHPMMATAPGPGGPLVTKPAAGPASPLVFTGGDSGGTGPSAGGEGPSTGAEGSSADGTI